jgi:hypothetical protein
VREIQPGGRTAAEQVSAGVTGLTPWMGVLGLRYTWTRSRDRVAGLGGLGGSAASTAGDPFRLEWATADVERRHALQAVVTHRVSRAVELSVLGHLASGLPFTPMVDGDVNGDGVLNDRAFVFDPAVGDDPGVGAGMERLLRSAPAPARACLRRMLGTVAERNACRSPWSTSLDLQANVRPGRLGLSRRLLVTVSAYNTLAGLDQLLHGSGGLRGWGQHPWVDNTLLRVRGFDSAARTFRYEVNPGFGEPIASRQGPRVPFAVVVQGRITVGADPAFQQLAGAVQALRSAPRSQAEVRRELQAQVPNVPARVLAEAGRRRLALSAEQQARLSAAADSVQALLDPLLDTLAARMAASGDRAGTQELLGLAAQAQALADEGLRIARDVLSPAQWRRLPDEVREPRRDNLLSPPQKVVIPTG